MPVIEDLKEYAERATGLRRPGKRIALDLVRSRKPHTVRFKDDGLVPNHPRWPLIIYRGIVDLGERHDPAAVIEDLFEANGGNKGRIFTLKASDVAILPAGIGHQCLSADDDFLVVGAYPPVGTYDECTTVEDRPRALKSIPKVPVPRKDPVYGADGPLAKLWKKAI